MLGEGDFSTRGLPPSRPKGRFGRTHGQRFWRTLHQCKMFAAGTAANFPPGRDGAEAHVSRQVWLRSPSSRNGTLLGGAANADLPLGDL